MAVVLPIAAAHVSNRRRQSLVSIIGVALGVGFFIALAALMQGFQQYFVQQIIDVAPHIIVKDEFRHPPLQPVERVFPGGAVSLIGVKPRDEVRGIRGARAKVAALAGLPDLAVAPTLLGQALLRYGGRDVSASVYGIEPPAERHVSNIEHDLTAGRLDDLYTTANGIILGDGLAEKLAVGASDTLTAVSPAGVVLRMKVVGIFHTGLTVMDLTQAYCLLKKSQILQNRPNVINQIRLRIIDVDNAEQLAAMIESRFGYRSESWQETNRNVLGIFVIQNAIIFATTSAILIVAAFGIYNIISTVVFEKTRDIAILKSIGLTERDIQSIFLLEGFAIGVVGAVLGWGIGFGFSKALGAIRFHVEGIVTAQGFQIYYWYAHYVIAAAFAIAASTLAALLPSRKAARLRPVDIIRGAA